MSSDRRNNELDQSPDGDSLFGRDSLESGSSDSETLRLAAELERAFGTAALAPLGPVWPAAQKPVFSYAWASGFADGEACFHIAKQRYKDPARKTTYRLRLCIEQNDFEVLEHFRVGLGVHGVIYDKKREISHNKQVYRLNYDGKHALQAIAALLPMLVRKRAEAQVAVAFWTQGMAGSRFGRNGLPAGIAAIRERFYWKLRKLK
jgi:hypothetical protein